MDDNKVTTEDVKIPMGEEDPDGDVEKLTVQVGGRVRVPERFLEYLELSEGDEIAVHMNGEDKKVEVLKWSLDNIQNL